MRVCNCLFFVMVAALAWAPVQAAPKAKAQTQTAAKAKAEIQRLTQSQKELQAQVDQLTAERDGLQNRLAATQSLQEDLAAAQKSRDMARQETAGIRRELDQMKLQHNRIQKQGMPQAQLQLPQAMLSLYGELVANDVDPMIALRLCEYTQRTLLEQGGDAAVDWAIALAEIASHGRLV